MAFNIDAKKLELIDRLLGIVLRQLPNMAGVVSAIKRLFKGEEISDAELEASFAELDAADADLQAAIDKRLGRGGPVT